MSLDLLDWRRRVVDLYAQVRADAASDPPGALARFREGRDELFGSHAESPIPEADRSGFAGLPWWPYDPAWRLRSPPAGPSRRAADSPLRHGRGLHPGEPRRRGHSRRVRSTLLDRGLRRRRVPAVPRRHERNRNFRRRPIPHRQDQGCRPRRRDGRLILDFNFAYNPSCSYTERWVCPLAPAANRLPVPITAGERL